MTGRRQAEQSEITALVTDLSLYSHLSLWHGQVEVVEDLQLAVRPAHISALDRKVLPSSRQSGLQVSLHVPVLQLQERKYCKKNIENHADDYYRTIILGCKCRHFHNSCHETAFFRSFHWYFDETPEGFPSMFLWWQHRTSWQDFGTFSNIAFWQQNQTNHFLTQEVFVPYRHQYCFHDGIHLFHLCNHASLLHRSRWSGYYHGEEQNYPQLPSCFTSSHTAHMLLLFLVKCAWREPLHSLHVCFCLYSCFIVIQPCQLSDNTNTAGCIPPPWPPISV